MMQHEEMLAKISAAQKEAQARHDLLVRQMGPESDRIRSLSVEQFRHSLAREEQASEKASRLRSAHSQISQRIGMLERYEATFLRYTRITEILEDMLKEEQSKPAPDAGRIRCLKMSLHYISYFHCKNRSCGEIHKSPPSDEGRPYCPSCRFPVIPPGPPVGDGGERAYAVTIEVNYRERLSYAEKQRIKPYNTLALLEEIDAGIDQEESFPMTFAIEGYTIIRRNLGPRINWRMEADENGHARLYSYHHARLETLKYRKEIAGLYSSQEQLIEEMELILPQDRGPVGERRETASATAA